METLMGICVGVGLSAACGFRIFVPMFAAGLACYTGHITPSEGFEWIGTTPALIAFGTATLLEIAAYYIPWVDNMLDTVATPSSIVAGTLMTASFIPEMSPLLTWSIAVILGGGSAGVVQGGTVLTRGTSSLGTGGLANPAVSTAELGGSIATASAAIFVPILAGLMVIGILAWAIRQIIRLKGPKRVEVETVQDSN